MIPKLHYITQDVNGLSHAMLAESACAGGVRWVQLRMKGKGYEEWKQAALETLAVCRKYNANLIINDNVLLAREIGADGVHLGKEDMAVREAREILGPDFIIGGTANKMEDVRALEQAEADYIGLGPYRFTVTKENLSPLLGLAGYEGIVARMKTEGVRTPLIAIGGIMPADVAGLTGIGMHGVAVSSAINLAQDRSGAAAEFLNEIAKAGQTNQLYGN
jgi:thiamine-phosphate pyrophosphorylase